MSKSQSGFGPIAVVLSLLTIIVVGFVGLYVFSYDNAVDGGDTSSTGYTQHETTTGAFTINASTPPRWITDDEFSTTTSKQAVYKYQKNGTQRAELLAVEQPATLASLQEKQSTEASFQSYANSMQGQVMQGLEGAVCNGISITPGEKQIVPGAIIGIKYTIACKIHLTEGEASYKGTMLLGVNEKGYGTLLVTGSDEDWGTKYKNHTFDNILESFKLISK